MEYSLVLREGKAVIDKDFFPHLSPSKFTDEWAAMTVKFSPYFLKEARFDGSTKVNEQHYSGRNVPEYREKWLEFVRNEVLGTKYRQWMKIGWNNGLGELTKSRTEKSLFTVAAALPRNELDPSYLIDFSYNQKRPTTQEDVMKILFSDEITTMVRNRNFALPFALLYKWCYYLTTEGCSSNWATIATDEYILTEQYKVVLGELSSKDLRAKENKWVRIGKKIASNSFQQVLRTKQKSIWGVTLLADDRISKHQQGSTEVVDIGPYLPLVVKNDMTRKDGTKFLIKFASEKWSKEDGLAMRIDELHRWCSNNDMDPITVAREFENKFGVKPGDVGMDFATCPKIPPINTLDKKPDDSNDNDKEMGGSLNTARVNETRGADDMGGKDGGDAKKKDVAETNKILDKFQKVSFYVFE